MAFEVIKQSDATAARRRIYFTLVDATDGITVETGITGAGRFSKNAAASAASTNNIVEVDATNLPGLYYIEATTAETDTLGTLLFSFKTAATARRNVQATIIVGDPYGATVDANVTAMAANVVTASAIATDAIGASELAADAAAEIADKVLGRNLAGGSDGGRTVKDALRPLRNKVTLAAGTMTVTQEDDTATAWTAAYTTATRDPLTVIDPA